MKFEVKGLIIRDLFGYKDIDLDLEKITVLVGNNGSGKSTILRIIHSLLTMNETDTLKLCEYAEMELSNNLKITYKNFDKGSSRTIVEKIFLETINSTRVKFENMESEEILKLMTTKLDNFKKHNRENKFKIFKNGVRSNQEEYITKFFNNIKIEFISNVDLSANSRLNFTTSSGEDANILDSSIKKELSEVFGDANPSKRVSLRKAMDVFLKESGKRIKRARLSLLIHCENSGTLRFESLSSGERQLLYIILKVVNCKDSDAIILMDEPEISLHLSWQEMLIDVVREINPLAQLIIVTHSPGIIMNGYRDSFRDMKDIESVYSL